MYPSGTIHAPYGAMYGCKTEAGIPKPEACNVAWAHFRGNMFSSVIVVQRQ